MENIHRAQIVLRFRLGYILLERIRLQMCANRWLCLCLFGGLFVVGGVVM